MTTIRAKIRRAPINYPALIARPWFVEVNVLDLHGLRAFGRATARGTHAEAIDAARFIIHEIDRELMAEVHDSRSTRYAARVEKIAAEAEAQLSPETRQMLTAAAALPSALVTLPEPPPFPMIPTAHLFKKEATA